MKVIVVAALVAFCFSPFFVINCFAIADQGGPKIGDVPPPLSLTKTIQGPSSSELSWGKLKGRVVVLEFWATWCGPCVRAIPHMNDLVEHFREKPVVFISVTAENEDVVRSFLKNHPIKAWIGLDDYEALNGAFHVEGIPHAVIVDATGHIAAITHPAEIKPDNIDEVLAGRKSSLPSPEVYTVNRHSDDVVANQSPSLFEISIREHNMPLRPGRAICMWSGGHDGCSFEGKIATVESALYFVFSKSDVRSEIHCELPDEYYDFELRAPAGCSNELQNEFAAALRTSFHLEITQPTKEMEAYVLTQISTNAPGFRQTDKLGGGGQMEGGFRVHGAKMEGVAFYLEEALGKPVIDQTGLTGIYDVNMKWKLSPAQKLRMTVDPRVLRAMNANPNGDWIGTLPKELREGEALKNDERLEAELAKPDDEQFMPIPADVIAAARERLGLQLTLVRRPIQILEVSKVSQMPSLFLRDDPENIKAQ